MSDVCDKSCAATDAHTQLLMLLLQITIFK